MPDMLGHYDLVGRATCPAVSLVSLLLVLAAVGAQRSISLSQDESRRSSATNATESVQNVLSSVATVNFGCASSASFLTLSDADVIVLKTPIVQVTKRACPQTFTRKLTPLSDAPKGDIRTIGHFT